MTNRCQDRVNAATLAEVQNYTAKLIMLQILASKQKDDTDYRKITKDFLTSNASTVDRRYIVDFLQHFKIIDFTSKFNFFVSFSRDSWCLCKSGHIYSAIFDLKCQECWKYFEMLIEIYFVMLNFILFLFEMYIHRVLYMWIWLERRCIKQGKSQMICFHLSNLWQIKQIWINLPRKFCKKLNLRYFT